VLFFTKLAQDRPRKAQYSAEAVFGALSMGDGQSRSSRGATSQFMFFVHHFPNIQQKRETSSSLFL
jgi:hypothetical protein